MAITLWKNRRPLEGIARFFDDDFFSADLFRDFFNAPDEVARNWTPAVDIQEQDGSYLLTADLPGVDRKDIHVELHDGYLTVRGERTSEREEQKGGYVRCERTRGSFQRSFRVPDGVTEKDITARYHDGVLELTVPAPQAEKPRVIEVTGA